MSGVKMQVRDNGVAVLQFIRPEKKNALRYADLEAFEEYLEEAAASSDVHALVVTGSGGSFCAGIDLTDLASRSPEDRGRGEARVDSIDRWQLISCPLPVVVAVDGPAVGMGVEITCQADMRIGSPDAFFSWNFGARGLIPDMGVSSLLLPHIVGLPKALDLLFSGRKISATEAVACGYLSEVAEDPVERAIEVAHRLAQNSPFAVKETKRLVYEGLLEPQHHLRRHDSALSACFSAPDHHEGVSSFLEKRPPQYEPPAFAREKA